MIVGIVDEASFPGWHMSLPANQLETFRREVGRPFPPKQVAAAARELDEFAWTLEAEGVPCGGRGGD